MDDMHYDGPSSILANDSQTATAVVRSVSTGRGLHLRGACGRDLVSTREVRRRLWRAGGAAALTAGSRTRDNFDQIASFRDD